MSDAAVTTAVAQQIASWNWSDIAAVIGAAAWLPVIIDWIVKVVRRPTLSIITDKKAEVGYTSFGPILNFRLALTSDSGAVVITHMKIVLVHESGERRMLEWQGMVQNYGSMVIEGQRMPMEKDQIALAMKVDDTDVEEKFIRFQDPNFHDQKVERLNKLTERINFVSKTKSDYHDEVLKSEEAHSLLEYFCHGCWWKPGKYTATITIKTTQKAKISGDKFTFTLSTIDIDKMHGNNAFFPLELENNLKHNFVEEYEEKAINWEWVHKPIIKL
jgi:hypothetical protein